MPFFSPYSYAGGVSRALVRFFSGIPAPGVFTCAFRLSPYGRGFLSSPVASRGAPSSGLRLSPHERGR